MECYDHLGNKFSSKVEMCRHYGIDYNHVFLKRLAKGYSLKEALTIPLQGTNKDVKDFHDVYVGKNGCYIDHLGNYYSSLKKLCSAWRTLPGTFVRRIKRGWTLEQALTFDSDVKVPAKDDAVIWIFGEPYVSYNMVDMTYGFALGTSVLHKYNLEKWIKSKERFVVNGKLFRTFPELTKEYGVLENTIRARLDRGWSIQDAVTVPVNYIGSGQETEDHLGNEFDTVGQMIQHYGLTQSQYYGRLQRGWTKEEALTTPAKFNMINERASDKERYSKG